MAICVARTGAAGAALLWEGEILTVEPHNVTPIDTIGADITIEKVYR